MVRRASVLARGAWVAAMMLGGACSAPTAPPVLDEPSAFDAGAAAAPSLIGTTPAPIPSCGVGPDGGVCACADEPLVLDPPTLYFVLDRSSSMNDGGKWSTVRGVLAKLVPALGPRVKLGAAVFPDPAQGGCAPGRQVFPGTSGAPVQGDGVFGSAGPVDRALISTLDGIPAAGGTPTAASLGAVLARAKTFGGKAYVVLATDGGPNCDEDAACTAAACTLNIESTNGCTPGGENCCLPVNAGTNLACLDAQPTLDAVASFASAGIPLYVVGIPGSEPYAQLLDQLAEAGGTSRGTEPQYYAVSTYDQQALYAAMSKIAAKVAASCTLTLDAVPPRPDLVNVFLGGSPLPQSGADGWTLEGTSVTILGASCQSILAGDVIDVRVVAGCPTVLN
jgi:hypothetical protein